MKKLLAGWLAALCLLSFGGCNAATNGQTENQTEEVPSAPLTYENYMIASSCQDGAIYNGLLFSFNAKAECKVFDLTEKKYKCDFFLDQYEVIRPHVNAVCFSDVFYEEGDTFPLLYANIYNNYSGEEDRMEGTCCVYRIMENASGGYTSKLVQVIRIGFVEDLTLWKSLENNQDIRSYGNFVVDTDNDKLYAFVMRDKEKQTRFFCFDQPSLDEGTYNEEYQCNVVTLEPTDIEKQFDVEYFYSLQGCCYYKGTILSVEGFNEGNAHAPAMRIVDLESQSVVLHVPFLEVGLTREPETISVYGDEIYYSAVDGILMKLKVTDTSIWE